MMRKMTQRVSNTIAYAITIITMLHVISLAAYVYDYIPDSIQKAYFWLKTDIYMLLMIGIFAYLIMNKTAKIALWTAFAIYAYYSIIVSIRFFYDISSRATELNWIIHFGVSVLLILFNAIYYVRSSK